MKKLTGSIAAVFTERRRLRSRTPLQIAIADRFSQLNAEHWHAVTRNQSLFYSAQYQRAFEQFRPDNLEPRYALISDGETPVAAMCMQIARVDLTQVGERKRPRALAKLGSKVSQRVLVCGSRRSKQRSLSNPPVPRGEDCAHSRDADYCRFKFT